MEFDAVNKKYWANVVAADILSGVHLPGKELFSRLPQSASVLDVGCGNGTTSQFLFELGFKVTAIDINESALVENRLLNKDILYEYADITETIPFADNTFEAAIIPYVFVSILDQQKARSAMLEIIRVVQSGGLVWLCEATYSPDYTERYQRGREITGFDNVAVSFVKDINNKETNVIQRIIKHYAPEDLMNLCKPLKLLSTQQVAEISPSSGMRVETIVSVYQK